MGHAMVRGHAGLLTEIIAVQKLSNPA